MSEPCKVQSGCPCEGHGKDIRVGRDVLGRHVALCPFDDCDHAVISNVARYGIAQMVEHMNEKHLESGH